MTIKEQIKLLDNIDAFIKLKKLENEKECVQCSHHWFGGNSYCVKCGSDSKPAALILYKHYNEMKKQQKLVMSRTLGAIFFTIFTFILPLFFFLTIPSILILWFARKKSLKQLNIAEEKMINLYNQYHS